MQKADYKVQHISYCPAFSILFCYLKEFPYHLLFIVYSVSKFTCDFHFLYFTIWLCNNLASSHLITNNSIHTIYKTKFVLPE